MGFGQYSTSAWAGRGDGKRTVERTATRKKRTRYVYPPEQVAHLWAHQAQESARNQQGNFYFAGPTIYSYGSHFPIARITEHKISGKQVVLFNRHGYSPTTSGHKGMVRCAMTNAQVSLKVNDPNADHLAGHKNNYQDLVEQYEKELEAAARARSNKDACLARAEGLRKTINAYRSCFLAKQKSCPAIAKPRDWNKAVAEAVQIRKAHDKRCAEAIAARKRREEKKRAENLKLWLEVGLPNWKANRLPDRDFARPPYEAPVDFRLIDGGETVQTTRGAQFPRAHCEGAFKAILRCRKNKAEWHRNGAEVRVGHFHIDRIDAEGNVEAGCHEIKWQQIADFARVLGLSFKDVEVQAPA